MNMTDQEWKDHVAMLKASKMAVERGELVGGTCSPSGTEADVCRDIAQRQLFGIRKYGQSVSDNPLTLKQWLQHAYEETLDQAVYLKRAIQEMENDQAQARRTGGVDCK